MVSNSGPASFAFDSKDWTAVLFLPAPAPSKSLQDWYGKNIAGLPFLLRNILNIQRGGIRHLVVYGSEPMETLRQKIAGDPRVDLNLNWAADSGQLLKVIRKSSRNLFLDGSCLHEKNKIRSALGTLAPKESSGTGRLVYLEDESLNNLLKPTDASPLPGIEKTRQNRDTETDAAPGLDKNLMMYLPEEGSPKIKRESDFSKASKRLLKSSGGLSNDSLITRILSRPVSGLLTRGLIDTKVTPNQITLISFAFGLASAACFFVGGYEMGIAGAVLLLLSIWVDGVDGEIARIKFMESPLGGKLDILCDNVVHIAVFFAIGFGLYQTHGDGLYLWLGLVAALGSLACFLLLQNKIISNKSTLTAKMDGQTDNWVDKISNRDFTHFLVLLALVDHLDWFLWMTALGVSGLTAFLLIVHLKSRIATAS